VGRFASGTFSEDHRPTSGSPLVLNGRGIHSAERLCGSGDDLIVCHVAQVLSDVPASIGSSRTLLPPSIATLGRRGGMPSCRNPGNAIRDGSASATPRC
jgi:hypothetical protein